MRAELAAPGRYQLHPEQAAAHASWWQLFAGWLGDRWNEFAHRWFPHLHVGASGVNIAGDAIVLFCVIVIGIAGARLLTSLQIAREQRRRATSLEFSHRSVRDLTMRAARAAEEHDFAHAVRLLFAAAITLLDLRGVVADEESATINELRAALRERNADSERPFVDLARIYTGAAYAERPIDRSLWERAHAAYDLLASQVRT